MKKLRHVSKCRARHLNIFESNQLLSTLSSTNTSVSSHFSPVANILETAFFPDPGKDTYQDIRMLLGMTWSRSDTKTFLSFRNSGEVDTLHINLVLVKQLVRNRLGSLEISGVRNVFIDVDK